jgi:hypothetical protein
MHVIYLCVCAPEPTLHLRSLSQTEQARRRACIWTTRTLSRRITNSRPFDLVLVSQAGRSRRSKLAQGVGLPRLNCYQLIRCLAGRHPPCISAYPGAEDYLISLQLVFGAFVRQCAIYGRRLFKLDLAPSFRRGPDAKPLALD